MRAHRLLGGLLASAVLAAPAAAQTASVADLEAQIKALEAAVAGLKAEIDAAKASDAAMREEIIRIDAAETASPPPARGPLPAGDDGFFVGDTKVQVGGIIDLDINVTDTSDGEIAGGSIARDFYIPSATPVGGRGEKTPDTDFTAEATRLYLTTETNAGEHVVKSRLEMDFLGSAQGNELVTNSYSPRLRHAFVEVDNWLFGQTWSTFQNVSSIPESASFLALSDGMVFVRQAQIRYTRGPWQFAIENPNTRDIVGGAQDDGFAPDGVVKYAAKGAWGNASVAGLARYLTEEIGSGAGAVEENALGWGVSVAGDINIGEAGGLKFSLTGGEGIGRYVGLAAVGDARMTAQGELEPISAVGGLLAYRHRFDDKTRGTIGWSGLFADAELGETESVQSAVAVLVRDVAPKTSIAAEIMVGRRTIEAAPGLDDEGDITRFTFSTKHAF